MTGEPTINRGTITLSPLHDEEWAQELLEESEILDRFHTCEVDFMSDGSLVVVFCDAMTEDECDYDGKIKRE